MISSLWDVGGGGFTLPLVENEDLCWNPTSVGG